MSTRLMIALSWILAVTATGCRFGNQVKYAPNPIKATLFATEPVSLSLCTSAGGCVDAPLTAIPAEIADVVTNPVYLVQDTQTQAAAIASSKNTKNNLPIDPVEADGSFSYLGSTAPKTLWLYDECTKKYRLMESGKTVKDRMELKVTMVMEIAGDCTQSLQEMYDCYRSVDSCPGQDTRERIQIQDYVWAHFDPYVTAKAMTEADIPTLSSTSYEVSYQ